MADLPRGTVTFLFTDIEGSTRLVEQLGTRYAAMLAAHRDLLRAAVWAHDGREVDTQGDAFFFAFARAGDALSAAADAQRALAAYPWPDGADVRVRMGLHTGEPVLTGNSYVGLDVHRAARISDAAHGGQVLLSWTARELAEGELPDGASLRDLGEHLLKDLRQPERLAQLVLEGLPAEFPPLRTLDRQRQNLPIQPTPLLGREREVAEVCTLVRDHAIRLVTLTGPGGIGKTRLSLQVAAEAHEYFADGTHFVALSAVAEPARVMPSIAQALGLRESGGRTVEEILAITLAPKHVLLLLDNFEQVIAAAPQIAALLERCPTLHLLVTSREPLRLRGEHEYPVPPLALPVPPTARHALTPDALARSPAAALFIERARAVKPDFMVRADDASAIAEICARLDGLPLAIELAAARSKLLSPAALLARLSHRLTLLTAGPRDLPERQQTLRSTIGWSDELLPPAERSLFRRSSIFSGGWSLDAAEAVCAAAGQLELDVLEGLGSLVDKSLVLRRGEVHGEPRFAMLETIREYGQEQLAASGEEEAAQRAHAVYFLSLAEQAEPQLTRPDQAVWLDRLEAEHDNLRAALAWARDRGEARMGLRLASALWRFWYTHGHLSEGRDWLDVLLVLSEGENDPALVPLRAKALYGAGTLASTRDDLPEAERLYAASLTLYRQLGDTPGAARMLNALGFAALHQGHVERSAALCAESLARSRALGDNWSAARALSCLGQTAFAQGDYARAGELFEEGLALMRGAGTTSHSAIALLHLGHVAREQGDLDRAAALYRESLATSQSLGDKIRIARGLEGMATVAAAGQAQRAAILLGAAEALRDELGAALHPIDRPAIERAQVRVRAALGDQAYDTACAAGRALPLEEAIAAALEVGGIQDISR